MKISTLQLLIGPLHLLKPPPDCTRHRWGVQPRHVAGLPAAPKDGNKQCPADNAGMTSPEFGFDLVFDQARKEGDDTDSEGSSELDEDQIGEGEA